VLLRVPIKATKADLIRVAGANPGARVELTCDGELTMSPPTGGDSSRRNADLNFSLTGWARLNGYLAFDSSCGFELPDRSIFSPDASLVLRPAWEALSADERTDFVTLVPVVAIEIVSKSDRPADLREKLMRFRSFGTSFVAVIDPFRDDVWTDGQAPANFNIDLTEFLK
jgi:Uma2 family endonuclease